MVNIMVAFKRNYKSFTVCFLYPELLMLSHADANKTVIKSNKEIPKENDNLFSEDQKRLIDAVIGYEVTRK